MAVILADHGLSTALLKLYKVQMDNCPGAVARCQMVIHHFGDEDEPKEPKDRVKKQSRDLLNLIILIIDHDILSDDLNVVGNCL